MKTFLSSIFCLFIITSLSAQDKPAYKLFTSTGKEVKWEKAVKDLENSDIVFFGELHDNTIGHWLEYELLVELYKTHKDELVLGMEMFESDNQKALDEYLDGVLDDKKFAEEARLWKNYNTDYRPMVDFAKEHKVPVIATNVPRRYASLVFKGDFVALDTLSETEKGWVAPLPILFDINLPNYQEMLKMGEEDHHMEIDEKYPKAQAVKDATMANFILKNKIDKGLFYHLNGSFHSDNFLGIVWYLNQSDKSLKIKTITTVEQDNINAPEKEFLGKADYLLVVPSSMTKTF